MDIRGPLAPVSSSIVLSGVRIQVSSGIVVHVISLVAFDTGLIDLFQLNGVEPGIMTPALFLVAEQAFAQLLNCFAVIDMNASAYVCARVTADIGGM